MDLLPPVTIIILNWNGRPFLQDCLSSLLALDYPDYTITVVDNASTDDSVAFIEQQFPQVNVQQNGFNIGFAAGNNTALRQLETELVVLLNPDVIVAQDWLTRLIMALLSDPTIGIAGCKLTYPDGRLQHAGGYITYPQAMPGHYGLTAPIEKQANGRPIENQANGLCDVDYVTGAAMAIRRPLLDKIGLFDEGYFLYYEEVDLCRRTRQAGYRVVYAPEATAVHLESAVAQKGSDSYLERMHTSRWRFLLKYVEIDKVLGDTIPAEKEWLALLPTTERQITRRVYKSTLKNLPEIWRARTRDGDPSMNEVSDNQKEAVAQGLQTLRESATRVVEATAVPDDNLNSLMEQLREKAHVKERPFTSSTPVVGPILVALRTAWNNVATKWYVRPLLQQQNEFNLLVIAGLQSHMTQMQSQAEEMKAHVERMQAHESWLIEQDRDHANLVHDTAVMSAQLIQMNRLLHSIDERLARLEGE